MIKHQILFFFMLVALWPGTKGQTLDKDRWETLKEEVDYQRYGMPEEKEEARPSQHDFTPTPPPASLNLGPMVQVILVIIFVVLIALLIYFILKNTSISGRNKGIKPETLEIGPDGEELSKTDLEKWLERALAANDRRLIIRIYFLMALQKMEDMKLIRWEKEKTNWQYLRELGNHHLRPSFQALVREYDLIWYGEKEFDDNQLQSKVDQFKGFGKELGER